MIRVDYSGLDWKKIATPTEMVHYHCGGRIWYNWRYDSHFCSLCGKWTEVKTKDAICEYSLHRPNNAINALNEVHKNKKS